MSGSESSDLGNEGAKGFFDVVQPSQLHEAEQEARRKKAQKAVDASQA